MPFFVLPEIKLDAEDFRTAAGNLRRGFVKVHNTLMRDAATYWHLRIFPGHFTPGNEQRYQMEPRTPEYLKRKRRYGTGQGRYVANVFSGMSFRWMMALAKVTATQDSATVRMQAPTYFTKPAVGTFTDKNGRQFTISRQPDKVKEVTQVNAADLGELQRYMQRRYDELCDQFFNRGQSMAKAA